MLTTLPVCIFILVNLASDAATFAVPITLPNDCVIVCILTSPLLPIGSEGCSAGTAGSVGGSVEAGLDDSPSSSQHAGLKRNLDTEGSSSPKRMR